MREEFNSGILKVLFEGFLTNKKSLVREYIILPNDTSNICMIFYQYFMFKWEAEQIEED